MTRPATLAGWLAYLETLHPKAIAMGLDRVRAVRAAHATIAIRCPVITVAGTNGKGSTCAMLEAIFATPAIAPGSTRRRICCATTSACASTATRPSDEALVAAFDAVETRARRAARPSTPLTYFEFGTLAALRAVRAARSSTC